MVHSRVQMLVTTLTEAADCSCTVVCRGNRRSAGRDSARSQHHVTVLCCRLTSMYWLQVTGTGMGAGKTPIKPGFFVTYSVAGVLSQGQSGDLDLLVPGDGKWGISWSFVPCDTT